MLFKERVPLWVFVQAAVVTVALCFTDMETGPAGGAAAGVTFLSTQNNNNGDRFKIEGRAIVPGVKTQDWVSAARILVEGEEYVGFVR